MPEQILDPSYWAQRLKQAQGGELHHAIFRCPLDRWQRIAAKHREILAKYIQPTDKILDVGCGWGRLLELMPSERTACYIGVDLSPDFIALAKERHPKPNCHFVVGDIRNWERSWGLDDVIKMDWAVLISIRPMVIRNLGSDVWSEMEREIRLVAKRLMYLEYDENCEGMVE